MSAPTLSPTTPRFATPQVVGTPGALEVLEQHPGTVLHDLLVRHFAADWGLLDDHDRQLQDRYLAAWLDHQEGAMLMSSFAMQPGPTPIPDRECERIWIISYVGGVEDYTCVLLPNEY